MASAGPGREATAALVLHFQEMFGALTLLLGQFAGKVAHALRSHIVAVEVEAQREVGVGGPLIHTDWEVEGGLYLGGIILTNLGAYG